MRRIRAPARVALAGVTLLATAVPAMAVTPDATLRAALDRGMRPAGSGSGAFVMDLNNGRVLYRRNGERARIPASNEKIYTTATALLRFGPTARLRTVVLGAGSVDASATFHGTLYLKGFGDPTFGDAAFVRSSYGTGATVSDLARALVGATGIRAVDGAVTGDESYFDSLRGGPAEGFARSAEVEGQLSALAFDRGLTADGGAFQRQPASFAAAELAQALRALGVRISGGTGAGVAPSSARQLAGVDSPTLATVARLTNRPSDNFFAEMLFKGLGARFGGAGSHAAGAAVVRAQLGPFGARPRVVDGSGLSLVDRTTPHDVVRVLARVRASFAGPAFDSSLSVAGRNGTLGGRMRGTAAAGRCRAKTGTLGPEGVSALSGYCTVRDGHTLAFSFLMNDVNITGARALQDRMAAAIARYRSSVRTR